MGCQSAKAIVPISQKPKMKPSIST